MYPPSRKTTEDKPFQNKGLKRNCNSDLLFDNILGEFKMPDNNPVKKQNITDAIRNRT